MRYLTELTYVNLSYNSMTGTVLILEAAQKLEGLELSGNELTTFPWEYFDVEKFQRLEFVNVNFQNSNIVIPEACIRFAYCFKRNLLVHKDGNEYLTVDPELRDLIERSADELIH